MGFRSGFITEDIDKTLPQWFVDKWGAVVNFYNSNELPISSKREGKTYAGFADLVGDLQKAIEWDDEQETLVLIWLHECGGITRVELTRDGIYYAEPTGWRV